MSYFKKLILLTTMGFIFSSSAEGMFSVPFLYPVKNPKQFNETSRYMSGLSYSWIFSSYLPEHVQKFVGRWHLQARVHWLHTIPRKKASTVKKTEEEKKRRVKIFKSYYPALVSGGLNWEFDQLHYIRPILGAGYAFNNPLDNLTLMQNSFLDKKLYYITAGLFFSFDIVDSNFSHRMNYEYNIRDMGLFVEYQKYYSIEQKDQSHWGLNIGLFVAL